MATNYPYKTFVAYFVKIGQIVYNFIIEKYNINNL